MAMALQRLLTISTARNLMLQGKPWTLRMEHTVGHNKFWLATGRAIHEPVEIHFGAIGAKPIILVKDWNYVQRIAPEKQAKGYVYVLTACVQVQASTITGVVPATEGITVTPPAPATGTGSVPPGPWGRIRQVQRQADGIWVGLSSTGTKVMGLTKGGAHNLVRDYPHIQVAGLCP